MAKHKAFWLFSSSYILKDWQRQVIDIHGDQEYNIRSTSFLQVNYQVKLPIIAANPFRILLTLINNLR